MPEMVPKNSRRGAWPSVTDHITRKELEGLTQGRRRIDHHVVRSPSMDLVLRLMSTPPFIINEARAWGLLWLGLECWRLIFAPLIGWRVGGPADTARKRVPSQSSADEWNSGRSEVGQDAGIVIRSFIRTFANGNVNVNDNETSSFILCLIIQCLFGFQLQISTKSSGCPETRL